VRRPISRRSFSPSSFRIVMRASRARQRPQVRTWPGEVLRYFEYTRFRCSFADSELAV
jgi:hypothetical protein